MEAGWLEGRDACRIVLRGCWMDGRMGDGGRMVAGLVGIGAGTAQPGAARCARAFIARAHIRPQHSMPRYRLADHAAAGSAALGSPHRRQGTDACPAPQTKYCARSHSTASVLNSARPAHIHERGPAHICGWHLRCRHPAPALQFPPTCA